MRNIIKEYSKENPKERNNRAYFIKEARKTAFEKNKKRKDILENLKTNTQTEKEKYNNEIKKLQKLQHQLDLLSDSNWNKIIHWYERKKLSQDIALQKHTTKNTKQSATEIENNYKKTQNYFSHQKTLPEELKDIAQQVDKFYEKKKDERMADKTKEQIEKQFSEEYLSTLSVEDYKLLLEKYSNQIVAHVTRQWIRDHTGHIYHTANMGSFLHGFEEILKDWRLRSPLGVYIKDWLKKEKILEYLKIPEVFKTKAEALKYLENSYNKDNFSDSSAIHFAANEVADSYYGSEKDNEIFIIYPSLLIKNKYKYHGTMRGGGWYHNDQRVRTKENEWININAWVVFIRSNAQVDPHTWSRYIIDENNNPIENTTYTSFLQKFYQHKQYEIYRKKAEKYHNFIFEKKDTGNLSQELKDDLENLFHIHDKNIQNILINDYEWINLQPHIYKEEKGFHWLENTRKRHIERLLRKHWIRYKTPEKTITSKQYREQYFEKHPNLRPSKIVYYDESDPTKWLHKRLPYNSHLNHNKDMNSRTDINHDKIALENKKVKDFSHNQEDYEIFKSIAKDAINQYFDKQKNNQD